MKFYDTTNGRYNRGVLIATEPGYYQFEVSSRHVQVILVILAGGYNAKVHRLSEALQSKYQGQIKSYKSYKFSSGLISYNSSGTVTIKLKLNAFDIISVKKGDGGVTRNLRLTNFFEGRRIS